MVLAPKDRSGRDKQPGRTRPTYVIESASFDSQEPRTRRTKMHQQGSEGMNLSSLIAFTNEENNPRLLFT